MDDCIFCRIADGRIPAGIVLEDEQFVAFQRHPPEGCPARPRHSSGNILSSLNDLDLWQHGEGHDLLSFIVRVAREAGIADSGYRVLTNVGPDAGQEVQHMHFHILGGEDLGDFR